MTWVDAVPDLTGRTFVLTGATSGIGEVAAAVLARRGGRVVIGARNPARAEATVARIRTATGRTVEVLALDLARLASVRAFADEVLAAVPHLDGLVLNAGLVVRERTVTEDGFETQVQANHLGHVLLAHRLEERLRASAPARVVVTSSTAHRSARAVDLAQVTGRYRGMHTYGQTKLASILYTRELARRLAGSGVTATCLHPGTVATGWGRNADAHTLLRLGTAIAGPLWFSTAERAASTIVHLAASPAVEGQTGGYWVRSRRREPSRAARDPDAARRLWDDTHRLLGL